MKQMKTRLCQDPLSFAISFSSPTHSVYTDLTVVAKLPFPTRFLRNLSLVISSNQMSPMSKLGESLSLLYWAPKVTLSSRLSECVALVAVESESSLSSWCTLF